MRKSLLSIAVLSAFAMPALSYADEVAPAPAPAPVAAAADWTITSNIAAVSNYKARGISQSWNKAAVQGGFDVAHASGVYAGFWGSSMSSDTFPNANLEMDFYGGYNGTIKAVEGLGWTAGVIGIYYPGAGWDKYADTDGHYVTPNGDKFTNWEGNVGLSYKWFSTKLSYGLTDWFGANKKVGWDGSTRGSTYLEVNANVPLPWWDLTFVAHAGHSNIAGKLDLNALSSVTNSFISQGADGLNSQASPDWTDYKIGFSKAFSIAKSEGWNAGAYWVGGTNGAYWNNRGYGGSSFLGSSGGTVPGFAGLQSNNLSAGRLVVNISRLF